MLEKGANLKHKDKTGFGALHVAALRGNLELFKFLLSKGADVNTRAVRHQRKPIHNLTVDGSGKLIRFLADEGVDISEPDQSGMTPLHHAVKVEISIRLKPC